MAADDLAGGIKLLLFLGGQGQDHDLLGALAAHPAGYPAVDAGLAIFPLQLHREGKHPLFVGQDGTAQGCQRLADAEGLSQEEAARQMEISPPTFCRLLAEARRRVAQALTRGCP